MVKTMFEPPSAIPAVRSTEPVTAALVAGVPVRLMVASALVPVTTALLAAPPSRLSTVAPAMAVVLTLDFAE
jgi:hypothetical protein